MPTAPDADVVTKLATLATWTSGTNLFAGPMRAPDANIPHLACFVLASGGPGPQAYADGTTTKLRYSAVQVLLRSAPRAFAAGQTLAREVRDTLHNVTLSGYIDTQALEAEPLYLGEIENGSHLWSMNFTLIHEQ